MIESLAKILRVRPCYLVFRGDSDKNKKRIFEKRHESLFEEMRRQSTRKKVYEETGDWFSFAFCVQGD